MHRQVHEGRKAYSLIFYFEEGVSGGHVLGFSQDGRGFLISENEKGWEGWND